MTFITLQQRAKRIGAAVLAALVLFALVYVRGCKHGQEISISPSTILKPNEHTQLLVNPLRHEITVVTREGITKQFLPDVPSKISVHDDGTVKVSAPIFGFQLRPFIGGGVTNKLGLETGIDWFYYNRFNLGIGAQFDSDRQVNAILHGSYVVWRNVAVGVVLDNHKHVGMDLTVRF